MAAEVSEVILHLNSKAAIADEANATNEHNEIKECKETDEYQKLNDPNDRSPLTIDLPSLPSDNRRYRFLRLENGIKILLIHHPIKVTSKALLRVAAGSYDEPDEFPGLAHFLEHMLFMGSTQYPDEDEYHHYIETYSGEYNANTDNKQTNFHFEIEKEHFEPVLDRFAQFFIAPLLKEECAEREIQAVNNEFEGAKEADLARFGFVYKKLVNPKHPESRFDFGNNDTLSDIARVLPALKQFYDKYYKANNMTLILQSKHSLDEQAAIAIRYFSSIPSTTEVNTRARVPQFLPEAFQVKYTIESIQHYNFFAMCFIFSGKRTHEHEVALKYIVSLMSHTSPGGLFDYLKSQGLVTNISGDISFSVNDNFDDDNQDFDVTIMLPLTAIGLSRTDDIVQSTLDYMYFIKQNGINEQFFKELQEVNETQLQFKAAQCMMNLDGFMDNLGNYPLKQFFLGSRITRTTAFPKQCIQDILDSFSPSVLQQFVFQDHTISGDCETEPYSEAKFNREAASASIKNWHAPMNQGSALPFFLPDLSPFIPSDFSIKPLSPQFQTPTLIHNENGLRVWLSQDHHCKGPSAQTDCYLISPLSENMLVANACASVFFQMFTIDLHRQLSRDLSFADASGSFFKIDAKGLQLSVSGYADKHDEIILKIFDLLIHFKLVETSFAREKQAVIDALLKRKTERTYEQARTYLPTLLRNLAHTTEELLKVTEELDIKSLQEYHKNLLSSVKVEVVCHGNMTPRELIHLSKSITQKLKLNEPCIDYPQGKIARISEGSNFHYSFNCNLNGNGLVLFLQAEDHSEKTKYLYMLLSNIVKPKFFHQLRTQEQLAYIIDCDVSYDGRLGLAFVIESSEYSADYLLERTEDFLKQMDQELKSISEAEFAASKKALNNTLDQMHQPTTPSEYRAIYLPRFQSNRYQFNRIFDIFKVHEEITLASLQAFYSSMIHPSTRRQVVVKSKDETWDASNLHEILAQNLEDSGAKEDSIAKVADLIFSYAKNSHHPYRTIEDIQAFKKETEWFPDDIAEGERYIQSLLEFNDDLPKESFANGEIVDEDHVKEVLATTSLVSSSLVVETILAYSFSHYKMRERTKLQTDANVVFSNPEVNLNRL